MAHHRYRQIRTPTAEQAKAIAKRQVFTAYGNRVAKPRILVIDGVYYLNPEAEVEVARQTDKILINHQPLALSIGPTTHMSIWMEVAVIAAERMNSSRKAKRRRWQAERLRRFVERPDLSPILPDDVTRMPLKSAMPIVVQPLWQRHHYPFTFNSIP
jgi:hypothetical protein